MPRESRTREYLRPLFLPFGGLPVHSHTALISMQDLRATSSYLMTFQAFVFLMNS